MKLEVSVHLREGENKTNFRSLALANALSYAGHKVEYRERGQSAAGSDLVIQTGFARSAALLSAIEQEIPYIIMEEPLWRDESTKGWSSWTYNGLGGGGWRPSAPDKERPKPPLQPRKDEGSTIIFGQKPTDHSLRGSDHVQWILQKLKEYPDAEFRHHPLMVPAGSLPPLRDCLRTCHRAITYNSTVGAEALIYGCESNPEHWGSTAYGVADRERWLHELSWGHFPDSMDHILDTVDYIISGYDEATSRAERGLQEIPREKVDGPLVCQRYYNKLSQAGIPLPTGMALPS